MIPETYRNQDWPRKVARVVNTIASKIDSGEIGGGGNGFADYNDATGDVSVAAETWTALPNNGAGAFTNLGYMPKGVTTLMDTATGKIDVSELDLGDTILVRTDFTITP